jgi:flagellar biosynthesis anti-sigma factor FlgM
MKIDDRKGVLDPQLVGTDPVRPDGRAVVPQTAQTGDRVSVSDTARQLAGLRAAVGDLGEVRPERVAVLQAAVDAGRYDVDPHAVAQSFLREVAGDALR